MVAPNDSKDPDRCKRGSECIMIMVTGANTGGLIIIGVMHVHRRQVCRIEGIPEVLVGHLLKHGHERSASDISFFISSLTSTTLANPGNTTFQIALAARIRRT